MRALEERAEAAARLRGDADTMGAAALVAQRYGLLELAGQLDHLSELLAWRARARGGAR